jgi:hypothetical protein
MNELLAAFAALAAGLALFFFFAWRNAHRKMLAAIRYAENQRTKFIVMQVSEFAALFLAWKYWKKNE